MSQAQNHKATHFVPMSLVMGILQAVAGVVLAVTIAIASWTMVQVVELGNEQAAAKVERQALKSQVDKNESDMDRRFLEQKQDQNRRFDEVLSAINNLSEKLDRRQVSQ